MLWPHRIKKEEKTLLIWLVLFFFFKKLHCIPDLSPDHCELSLLWVYVFKGRRLLQVRIPLHQALRCVFSHLTSSSVQKVWETPVLKPSLMGTDG